MQRRIRILNSTTIHPDGKSNYVIDVGADSLNQTGLHSVEGYINKCIELMRDTLIFNR